MLVLHNVTLQVDKDDKWLWTLESSHTFSVCKVYNFLTIQPRIASSVVASSLWHKDVPLKVVLFAWRLFWDRLPTKDNLLRRGVIDHDSRECVAGCGSVESSYHFSYIVIFLGLSGILFIDGWAFLRPSLFMCQIILINSVITVVLQSCDVQFYKLFSLLLFGKFGKWEVTGYSKTKNVH